MPHSNTRLAALTPARLGGIRRGVEKESLRALPDGQLALTPHPLALGSALTESEPVLTAGQRAVVASSSPSRASRPERPRWLRLRS